MAESTLRRKPQLARLNLLDRVGLRRQRLWPRLGRRALRWIVWRTVRLTLVLSLRCTLGFVSGLARGLVTVPLPDGDGRGNQSCGPNEDRLSHALSHTGEIR